VSTCSWKRLLAAESERDLPPDSPPRKRTETRPAAPSDFPSRLGDANSPAGTGDRCGVTKTETRGHGRCRERRGTRVDMLVEKATPCPRVSVLVTPHRSPSRLADGSLPTRRPASEPRLVPSLDGDRCGVTKTETRGHGRCRERRGTRVDMLVEKALVLPLLPIFRRASETLTRRPEPVTR
jgi:hypothetical protein